ncbi:MAG: hypothetical protein AB7G21_02795 [Dehalococcoidia bacterium]
MTRCSGTPMVAASCPRTGRLTPLRTRALTLNRDQRRAVVRSYPDSHVRRAPSGPVE